MRGRVPDRAVELTLTEDKKFSVLVVEVKTVKSSLKSPDQIKLVSMLKDMFDHALMKGVVDYTPVSTIGSYASFLDAANA